MPKVQEDEIASADWDWRGGCLQGDRILSNGLPQRVVQEIRGVGIKEFA